MLRLVRPLRAALVALVLAGATLSGCASGPKMTKIEAPAEGLTLRYDLTPGQTYDLRIRTFTPAHNTVPAYQQNALWSAYSTIPGSVMRKTHLPFVPVR